MTMIPVKIQTAQIGALSADKTFQGQKNLPENAHRIFESAVKREIDESRTRTEAAEKSEKGRIKDKQEEKNRQHEKEKKAEGKQKGNDGKTKPHNYIEKQANGTIKHLDVKI